MLRVEEVVKTFVFNFLSISIVVVSVVLTIV